jgi:hypothetical protein
MSEVYLCSARERIKQTSLSSGKIQLSRVSDALRAREARLGSCSLSPTIGGGRGGPQRIEWDTCNRTTQDPLHLPGSSGHPPGLTQTEWPGGSESVTIVGLTGAEALE